MGFLNKRPKRKTLLGEKKRRRRKRITVAIFLVLIVVIATSVWVLRREKWQISEVYLYEGSHVPHVELEEMVWELLSEKYLFIIPKTSISIYPKDTIEEKILYEFPRVKEVKLDREFPRALHITLLEHEPHALWCSGLPQREVELVGTSTEPISETTVSDCYYINDVGYIFSLAPSFSNLVYFKYYGRDGDGDPLRTYMLDSEYFVELNLFKDSLEGIGLNPNSLTKNNDGTFILGLKEGGYILLDKNVPLNTAFDNLVSILRDPETDLSPLSRTRENIDYIDLRYDRKVYYKLLNTIEE